MPKKLNIKKIDTKKDSIINEYNVLDILPYHRVEYLYDYALKNVDFMFHIESELDECPGGFQEEFVVNANNKLIKLLSFDEGGQDGDEFFEYSEHTVYLPISVEDSIVLAPEGYFDRILQPDLSLDLFEYKSSIGIAIEELVVVRELVMNNKNDDISEILYFYYWNGFELELNNKTIMK